MSETEKLYECLRFIREGKFGKGTPTLIVDGNGNHPLRISQVLNTLGVKEKFPIATKQGIVCLDQTEGDVCRGGIELLGAVDERDVKTLLRDVVRSHWYLPRKLTPTFTTRDLTVFYLNNQCEIVWEEKVSSYEEGESECYLVNISTNTSFYPEFLIVRSLQIKGQRKRVFFLNPNVYGMDVNLVRSREKFGSYSIEGAVVRTLDYSQQESLRFRLEDVCGFGDNYGYNSVLWE